MIPDLILPIIFNKYQISYIIFDENLCIFDFTENISQFIEPNLKIKNKADIREFFWEFVGLEETLNDLLQGKQERLHIPLMYRNDIYYDIDTQTCFIENKKYFISMFTKQQKNEYLTAIQKINEDNLQNYKQNDAYNKINKKVIIFHIDRDGFIKKVNSACTNFLGLQEKDLLGKHFSLYFSSSNRRKNLNNNISILKAKNKDGIEVFLHVEIINISNNISSDKVIICQDVTYLKKIEAELEYAANHDNLTGLPNRVYLMKRIDENIEKCKENKLYFALCFIDLNKFKPVNDTYGHNVGDMLLKHVGKVLKSVVREEDTVSRIGGDEFVILLENLEAKDYLEQVLLRIEEVSKEIPFKYKEDLIIELSFSLGTSIYPTNGENAKTLLDNADKDMYLKKLSSK